jgi:single-strand DNA-binding protein
MIGVNKVIIIGHLGADPEIHRAPSTGAPIASFSLATSERWTDKATGEKRDRTEWHRVVVYQEGLAKIAEQYLKKGSKIYVEGKNQTRKWTDRMGIERYTTEVVLSGFNAAIVLCDRVSGARAPTPAA